MLKKSVTTFLPPERLIPKLAEDQDWLRERAQGYANVDSLLVPPRAVSVFESALFKLYKAGIYTESRQIPLLHEGRFDGPWVSGVRIYSDLIIYGGEDGCAYIEVCIEYRNQIGEVFLRERIETLEDSPFVPTQNIDRVLIPATDDSDEMILQDCAHGIEKIRKSLDSDYKYLGIPGDHSGPRFLTAERHPAYGVPWMHADALNLSPASREWRMKFKLEGRPFHPIYANQDGGYETHVPAERVASPSIALPTEKSWVAAVAVTAGTPAERDFVDEDKWLAGLDSEDYQDLSEMAEEQDASPELLLLDLVSEPEFPMIVIADASPFSRYRGTFDPTDVVKESFKDKAQILRVTWPMQIFLQSAIDNDSSIPPGSARLCFPKAYREFGVSNILVTPDEIFKAQSWDGSLDDEDLRDKWWRERFEEALIAAFIPCTELHPEYVRLRNESSRLHGMRLQIELDAIDAKQERIRADHKQMIDRWDDLDSAEKKYKSLRPQYDELFEISVQALDEVKGLKIDLSNAIHTQNSSSSITQSNAEFSIALEDDEFGEFVKALLQVSCSEPFWKMFSERVAPNKVSARKLALVVKKVISGVKPTKSINRGDGKTFLELHCDLDGRGSPGRLYYYLAEGRPILLGFSIDKSSQERDIKTIISQLG